MLFSRKIVSFDVILPLLSDKVGNKKTLLFVSSFQKTATVIKSRNDLGPQKLKRFFSKMR